MNDIWTNQALLEPALLEPTAWALVHFLWQGALVALVSAGVLALERGRSARRRYFTACAGLVAMAVLPVATAVYLHQSPAPAPVLAGFDAAAPASAAMARANTPEAVGTPAGILETARFSASLEPALPWLVALWMAGMVLLSIAHAGGWHRVRRLRHDTRPAPALWDAAVERLTGRLGITRPVRLYESARTRVPVVLGWLRPVILVPASAFSGLTPQQLEAVLAHELAHVRRHDYLVNLFQLVVETVLFYHPGVWWMSRQVRIERENCCDDLAVEVCGNPVVYARALADLERLRFGSPAFALGADGGSLVGRVRRLVGRGDDRPAEGWLAVMIAALVAALVATLGVALVFVASSSSAMPAVLPDDEPELVEPSQSWAEPEADTWAEPEEAAWAEPEEVAWAEPEDGWDGSEDDASASETWDSEETWNSEESWDSEEAWDSPEDDAWQDEDDEDDRTGGRWWNRGDDEWLAEEIEELRRAAADTPYAGLGDDDLRNLVKYGFDGELFSALVGAGLGDADIDALTALARYGVDGEDVRELTEAGHQPDSTDDYVRLARYGVGAEDVRGYRNAGMNLDVDEMIRLAKHGVDGDDVGEYAASGLAGLTVDKIVQLAKHGVDGDDAREYHEAGFDLSVDDLVKLARYGVDGEDALQYKRSGYDGITVDDMLNLARYGLDGDDVGEYEKAGLKNLSIEDMLRLARYGVGGDDVDEYVRAGLEPSVDELLALARQGVGGDDVEEYLASGYSELTVEQMLELARHGVGGDDLKEIREAGHDLPIDEILRLARRGQLYELTNEN